MKIRIKNGLPYISATLIHRRQRMTLKNILLDTGSAGTIFSTDKVATIGLTYEPEDFVHRIRGVGGSEFVFTKRVDELKVGGLKVSGFELEIGAMNYGFDMDGIIGLDFLTAVGALIDLDEMKLRAAIE
ncbi:MAG TPA: retropepsin-like aspartic protease [Anaerolineales bacterium]|nr:retropepsin-like aspartic protease [Anaerolineales bacterium]HQX15680.1 retropepsin-like aspartic protease [Anaerolineales bacterium]